MPEAPAVCDNCKNIYPSGYGFDPGGTGVTVKFDLPSSLTVSRPCPACGKQRGRLLGGVYSFFQDSMELLQGYEGTVEELRRFRGILTDAQSHGASVDEIQERVERETPGLSPLFARLLASSLPASRQARMELVGWLALIATTVGVLLDWWGSAATEKVVHREVTNYNITVQAPTEEQQRKVRRNMGRNDPCWCGSGEKFKKCHGDPIRDQDKK